jgi:hypothetical protein
MRAARSRSSVSNVANAQDASVPLHAEPLAVQDRPERVVPACVAKAEAHLSGDLLAVDDIHVAHLGEEPEHIANVRTMHRQIQRPRRQRPPLRNGRPRRDAASEHETHDTTEPAHTPSA